MPTQKVTKDEIVLKSITVFRQSGYYRTNMRDLAKFCGLTKGAFYHYFSSKEDVMRNSLEMTSLWFKKNIFSIGYNNNIPEEKRLELMLNLYLKTFTQEPGGCFFANTILETTQVEDTFKGIMIDFFDSWEKSLQHIFSHKYENKIAKEKSIQVITNLEGAIILMVLKSNGDYLKDAIKRSIRLY